MRGPRLRTSTPLMRRVRDLTWRVTRQPYARPSLLDERWIAPDALRAIRTLLHEYPLVVLDAGARGGPRDLLDLKDVTRLYGFEPNEAECRPLQNEFFRAGYLDARYAPVALAGSEGERRLVLTRSAGSSSFYEPDLDTAQAYDGYGWMYEPIGEAIVPATTLDAFVAREGLAWVDFVKLDVQAAELEVLEGGRATLAEQVTLLRTEVWFRRFYRDQPLFPDVDRELVDLDFVLLSIDPFVNAVDRFRTALPPGVGDRGEFLSGDAIYVKDPTRIEGGDSARALRLVLMLESFGFVGVALTAVETLREAAARPELLDALAAAIAKRHRRRWFERRAPIGRMRNRLLRRRLGRLPYNAARK